MKSNNISINEDLKEIIKKSQEKTNGRPVHSEHILKTYMENKDIEKIFRKTIPIFDYFISELDEKIIKLNNASKTNLTASKEVEQLVVKYAKDKDVFFKELLKTASIYSLLDDSLAKTEDVIKAYENKDNPEELLRENMNELTGENSNLDLSNLFVDLTQKMSMSETDIIGRDKEINKIIQILQRKTKNNPMIVGNPGVGKTAVVEALAKKMAKGDVPDSLKGKKIFQLELSSLVSDTKYQGDLEKKINLILKMIKESNNSIILFIDEIHNIAGKSSDSTRLGVSEMLKPALSRGELSCIGATTTEEYVDIEKNEALERRFQKIIIDEPSFSATISMLRSLKKSFESHHKVKIDDLAILETVKLADRYITDKNFPDKAIDVLDEASAIVKISLDTNPITIINIENLMKEKTLELDSFPKNNLTEDEMENLSKLKKELQEIKIQLKDKKEKLKEEKEVFMSIESLKEQLNNETDENKIIALKNEIKSITPEYFEVLVNNVSRTEILKVIASKTGIPLDKIEKSEKDKVLELENNLNTHVIGQTQAVSSVSRAIKRSKAGLSDPNKPLGSFLFLGSTGVGKTELCKQLAYELFGSKHDVIRFDMSEFQQQHTVSTLIGSPKGYEGSSEGGVLTEAVRAKPYSIVLFDEIEKAHKDVLNILLQTLDEGHLTDARGRRINFKNTIIVLTSNIGSKHLTSMSFRDKKDKVLAELKKELPMELINRIDEKIVFDVLSKESLRKITKLMLEKTIKQLEEQKIEFNITDEAIDYLADLGYEPAFGARPIKRVIQDRIDDVLSDYIISESLKKGDGIEISKTSNSLQFVIKKDE